MKFGKYIFRFVVFVGAASLLSVSMAYADSQERGTCDVIYDGSPILAGDCLVKKSANELTLSSLELKGGGTNFVPETQVKFWIDEVGISYAGFYTGDMSRFAEVFMSDGSNQKSMVGGCFEHTKLRACFSVRSDSTNLAEEVFRSADLPQRIGLQQFMAEAGYYRGEIDGLWGPNMASGLAFMVDVSAVANSLGGGWDLIDGSSQESIANLLEKVAAGSPPSVMGVYRFCDAIDVNLFDAQTLLAASSFEAVRDKYGNLADAGCALFFVEGE